MAAVTAIFAIPASLFVLGAALRSDDVLSDCKPADLDISARSHDGASPPQIILRVRNDGASCALVGAPQIELRAPGGEWQRPAQVEPERAEIDRWDGVLRAGQVVTSKITGGTDAPRLYDQLRLGLAGRPVKAARVDSEIGTPLDVGAFALDDAP